jgi:integrase
MNYVEPIRDSARIKDICEYLKNDSPRNYIMFLTGIYSGLRISDILELRIRDIKNRDYVFIREKKTRKQKKVTINPILKKEIKVYCEGKNPNEFLVKSREGENKAISREMAYKVLRDIGDRYGITNLGTHSMRKTFGYHHYMQFKDVALLQKIFNHASPAITLRYIGIEQEYIDRSMRGFRIY